MIFVYALLAVLAVAVILLLVAVFRTLAIKAPAKTDMTATTAEISPMYR